MYTHCRPSTTSDTPSSIQCSENVIGPIVTGPNASGSVSSRPSSSSNSPGLNRKKSAP